MLAVQQHPYMEVQISKECSTPPTLIAAMSGLEVKREDDDLAEQVDKGTDGLYFSDLLLAYHLFL